jgi:hypothetical protein
MIKEERIESADKAERTTRWRRARLLSPIPGSNGSFLRGSSVVVVGIVYPQILPQAPKDPHDAADGGWSRNLIFYDPIPFIGSENVFLERLQSADKKPQEQESRKSLKRADVARAEAMEAVVRDLARLTAKKRGLGSGGHHVSNSRENHHQR